MAELQAPTRKNRTIFHNTEIEPAATTALAENTEERAIIAAALDKFTSGSAKLVSQCGGSSGTRAEDLERIRAKHKGVSKEYLDELMPPPHPIWNVCQAKGDDHMYLIMTRREENSSIGNKVPRKRKRYDGATPSHQHPRLPNGTTMASPHYEEQQQDATSTRREGNDQHSPDAIAMLVEAAQAVSTGFNVHPSPQLREEWMDWVDFDGLTGGFDSLISTGTDGRTSS
ncbi:hypothetical protein DL763_007573 [Monosporascus cannonballus]|nr:hypothetical protein DL763_007573 [Monosporascus cannonballus]